MRTTPLVGRKAWFGPRRLGWGLGPSSPEGWVVTALAAALAVWSARRPGTPPWIAGAIAGAFCVVAVLKGTAPGGPRARAALRAGPVPPGERS